MSQHISAALRVTRLPLGDQDVFLAEGSSAEQAAAACLVKARAAGWRPPSVLRFWEVWRLGDDRAPRVMVWPTTAQPCGATEPRRANVDARPRALSL